MSNGALLLADIAMRHVLGDMVARAMQPPKGLSSMHRSTYTDTWPFQCPKDGVTSKSAAFCNTERDPGGERADQTLLHLLSMPIKQIVAQREA